MLMQISVWGQLNPRCRIRIVVSDIARRSPNSYNYDFIGMFTFGKHPKSICLIMVLGHCWGHLAPSTPSFSKQSESIFWISPHWLLHELLDVLILEDQVSGWEHNSITFSEVVHDTRIFSCFYKKNFCGLRTSANWPEHTACLVTVLFKKKHRGFSANCFGA